MKHTPEGSASRRALYWIKTLKLKPHPEGGWFRETYRARETIGRKHLPGRYNGPRAFSTAIYFLLEKGQFSAFHRLQSDEIWHFYAGAPVDIFSLQKNGALEKVKLGLNPRAGERPQALIPAGRWFAAALAPAQRKAQSSNLKAYALLGCTVAPGFDFADFEIGARAELCRQFPRQRRRIEKMTPAP